MATLLDSFKKIISSQDKKIKEIKIQFISFDEQVVAKEKHIIVNHSKNLFFGQISFCEPNNFTAEICIEEDLGMIYHHHFLARSENDLAMGVQAYFDFLSDSNS